MWDEMTDKDYDVPQMEILVRDLWWRTTFPCNTLVWKLLERAVGHGVKAGGIAWKPL